jgi:hypothetical protein
MSKYKDIEEKALKCQNIQGGSNMTGTICV